MRLVSFTLRRPISLAMIVVALLGTGILALTGMRVDIFPAINAPQIYVVNNYAGTVRAAIESVSTEALIGVSLTELMILLFLRDLRTVGVVLISIPLALTVRNANTGDYVQAVTGDRSTESPSPIFVVARTDLVRVFVDVPEAYARYLQKGPHAFVRIEALSGVQIPASVVRASWSLNERTRTLRAETDLPVKTHESLRPGVYVYGEIVIERPDVYALPRSALVVSGNQTYCYLLQGGKAVKTPVEAGISGGAWIEVDKMKTRGKWSKVSGDEDVILGDLSGLTDGESVTVAQDGSERSR